MERLVEFNKTANWVFTPCPFILCDVCHVRQTTAVSQATLHHPVFTHQHMGPAWYIGPCKPTSNNLMPFADCPKMFQWLNLTDDCAVHCSLHHSGSLAHCWELLVGRRTAHRIARTARAALSLARVQCPITIGQLGGTRNSSVVHLIRSHIISPSLSYCMGGISQQTKWKESFLQRTVFGMQYRRARRPTG